jgi:hypothetical protein
LHSPALPLAKWLKTSFAGPFFASNPRRRSSVPILTFGFSCLL